MCGIVGMVSSSSSGFLQKHVNVFSQMLWADTLRGDDSTGAFGVNKYGNFDWLKEAKNAASFLESKEYDAFKDSIYKDYRFVVGHNRKATRGFTTDENAHPFVEESSILVHNGTLVNYLKLTDKPFNVDSHAILHSIVERGYEATLKELEGAFTLVWYDAKEKRLNLIRNEERPMFVANTVGAWYFASERGMLEWILGREDEKIEDMTDCKPGTLYFWDLEDKNYTMWHKPVQLYKKESPKSNVIQLPDKREPESTDYVKTLYKAEDFQIGSKITVQAKEVKAINVKDNLSDWLIFGHWKLDPTVNVACRMTTEELATLEKSLDTLELSTDDFTFECEIQTVVYNMKRGKISLNCKNGVPYIARYDMLGMEMFRDEFMLTDKKCSYCTSPVDFEDLEKGKFAFTNEEDHEIMCPKCYDACIEKGISVE